MRDLAPDPALELLRTQRSRLADRLRPPWWYLPGAVTVWGLIFASPFSSGYLPRGGYWAITVAALAAAFLLQWGLDRVTGIKVGPRPLRVLRDGLFYYRPGRSVLTAMLVLSLAALAAESSLIHGHQVVSAVAVAVLAVVAQAALQLARLQAIRAALRDGSEPA